MSALKIIGAGVIGLAMWLGYQILFRLVFTQGDGHACGGIAEPISDDA